MSRALVGHLAEAEHLGLSVAPTVLSRLARAGYVESSGVAAPVDFARRSAEKYSSTVEISLVAFAGMALLYRNEDGDEGVRRSNFSALEMYR